MRIPSTAGTRDPERSRFFTNSEKLQGSSHDRPKLRPFRDCIKAPPTVTRIQLSDGRMLAFSEYGIPDGKPIFYCHGFPASRLEARVLDPAAVKLGLRLISVDRPGYGLSDFTQKHTLAAWPGTSRSWPRYWVPSALRSWVFPVVVRMRSRARTQFPSGSPRPPSSVASDRSSSRGRFKGSVGTLGSAFF